MSIVYPFAALVIIARASVEFANGNASAGPLVLISGFALLVTLGLLYAINRVLSDEHDDDGIKGGWDGS